MDSEAPARSWQLVDLTRVIQLLAASSPEQQQHLQALGSWPALDELGLEFDDIYAVVPQLLGRREVSAEAVQAIDELNAILAQSPSGSVLWTEGALDRPEWVQVRESASRALQLLRAPNA